MFFEASGNWLERTTWTFFSEAVDGNADILPMRVRKGNEINHGVKKCVRVWDLHLSWGPFKWFTWALWSNLNQPSWLIITLLWWLGWYFYAVSVSKLAWHPLGVLSGVLKNGNKQLISVGERGHANKSWQGEMRSCKIRLSHDIIYGISDGEKRVIFSISNARKRVNQGEMEENSASATFTAQQQSDRWDLIALRSLVLIFSSHSFVW